ncbi:MAG: prolyl-tRNA synthetase associated domain-containing protein [Candidatus Aminicenantes bacterium]|nr:prolyl-tRNA synthetase associated domain-containing protein [Candidatus Aminicenantes bacterium]
MEKNLAEEEKKLLEVLARLNINWKRHEHPEVFNLDQARLYWKDTSGAHCKNLFLRNYRGNHHYLVIVEAEKKINLKKLTSQLAEDRLSFASAGRLQRYLGVSAGAVSPFGLINGVRKEVVVVVDEDLMTRPVLNFHPNVNTATVEISKSDFLKFLEWSGQKVIFLKLEASG